MVYIKKILLFLMVFLVVLGITGCKKSKDSKDYKNDSRVVWTYDVGGGTYIYYSTPALSEDEETIYIGTSKKIQSPQSDNDRLLALTKDGKLKWQFDTNNGEIRSNLVVYKDYIYFVADYDRTGPDNSVPKEKRKSGTRSSAQLFAVKSDGTLAWKKQVAGSDVISDVGLTSIAVQNDKVMIVTDYVYVFNYSTGELLHQSTKLQSDTLTHIRVTANSNKGYFMLKNKLYELDMNTYQLTSTDLSKLDNRLLSFSSLSTIHFDSNNNIYIGGNQKVVSLDKNKKLRWIYEHDTKGDFRSTPAINEERGELYIGTKANDLSKFIALNIDTGELIWSYHTGRDIYNSPTIDKNGIIYFASETEKLHIFNPDGTIKSEIDIHQQITWASPVIDSKGILYIAGMGFKDKVGNSSSGIVYAINTLAKEK